MRRPKVSGNFILCLLLNMLLNLDGLIPAAILLVLHIVLNLSLWWTVLAVGLWLLGLILWMVLIGLAADCGNTPTPPRENKNPYSVKIKDPYSTDTPNQKK